MKNNNWLSNYYLWVLIWVLLFFVQLKSYIVQKELNLNMGTAYIVLTIVIVCILINIFMQLWKLKKKKFLPDRYLLFFNVTMVILFFIIRILPFIQLVQQLA